MTTANFVELDRLSVGIVEDNPYFRRLVRAMLVGLGIRTIREATSVAEGWAMMLATPPDILLVDWVLGDEEGAVLLDRIRSASSIRVATQTVAFLSAHSDRRHVLLAARLGANDFIVKPISPRLLYERLRRLATARVGYVRRGGRLVPVPAGHAAAAPSTPKPATAIGGFVKPAGAPPATKRAAAAIPPPDDSDSLAYI